MGVPFLFLLGCEPTNEIDGRVDGESITIASAWWTQYVSVDGTEHPQYLVTLSSMEEGCQAKLDYLADMAALGARYDAGELSPEEYVAAAEETFAANLPSELWQVLVEFLVQEGAFTELRVDGADWDRYPQPNEIAANFVHQEGMGYSSIDMTTRYVSHQGNAEITYNDNQQTFEGEFTTAVTDLTGQNFEEVTILFEVEACEGLAFDEAAVWW